MIKNNLQEDEQDLIDLSEDLEFYSIKKSFLTDTEADNITMNNEFFDPNQISIINTIKRGIENKSFLLDDFPHIKSAINSEIGFALQIKRWSI